MYADQYPIFEQLTDEQAGKLIKHIFQYVNDEDPETDDPFINLAFTPIKQALKRDLKHWEDVRKKRSEAGKKSAESRKQKSTSVKSVEQTSTNPTVIVKDKVKDKVKDIDIYRQFDHLSITLKEYNTLCQSYKKDCVEDVLDRIENYEANTKYKSLYLTAKNWLARDINNRIETIKDPEQQIQDRIKYLNDQAKLHG